MPWMEQVWERIETEADAFASKGRLLSMADARVLVPEICRETQTPRPDPDVLEFIASEFVRATHEAHEKHKSRLRLRRVS